MQSTDELMQVPGFDTALRRIVALARMHLPPTWHGTGRYAFECVPDAHGRRIRVDFRPDEGAPGFDPRRCGDLMGATSDFIVLCDAYRFRLTVCVVELRPSGQWSVTLQQPGRFQPGDGAPRARSGRGRRLDRREPVAACPRRLLLH